MAKIARHAAKIAGNNHKRDDRAAAGLWERSPVPLLVNRIDAQVSFSPELRGSVPSYGMMMDGVLPGEGTFLPSSGDFPDRGTSRSCRSGMMRKVMV